MQTGMFFVCHHILALSLPAAFEAAASNSYREIRRGYFFITFSELREVICSPVALSPPAPALYKLRNVTI
jgi:hypothetical protein